MSTESRISQASAGSNAEGARATSTARVLVTGATGFIGFEVARQLAVAGRRPRLLVRRPARGRLLSMPGVEAVYGDLQRPSSLARAVEGIDEVIHLAARATFERDAKLRPTIVDGSLALFDAARAGGVKRFIFASSLLVYGSSPEPITDKTSPAPAIGYGRVKLEAEQGLRARSSDALTLGILRLPHVYGARSFLFDQLRSGLIVLPGSGWNTHGHLHVHDAARLLIAAASAGWVGTSPVADDYPTCWNDFFRVLDDHYHRVRMLRMPRTLALAGAHVLERLADLRRRPTLFAPDTVRGWGMELPVAPGLVWPELGLSPRYPSVAEGLPASLDELVSFRWQHPVVDASGLVTASADTRRVA